MTDAETGKVYKDVGRANSYIARSKWDVNAQPNYVLLSPDGEMLVPGRGYDLSIDGFVSFLQSGLDAYQKYSDYHNRIRAGYCAKPALILW